MKLRGGYTNYGETIGILMLDIGFPRPRGDIENAFSYDFPVRYKIVRAHATKIMGDHPDASLREPFVVAAQELEAEGVKAIMTSCGFLAPFQKQIAAALHVPVFTSILIQAQTWRGSAGEQCCASAHFGAHVGKTCRKDRQNSHFAIPAACHLELAVSCSLS